MTNWLSRKFSRRLAVALCLTSAVAVVGTGILVGRSFDRTLFSELSSSLTTTTALVESQTDKALFIRRDVSKLHRLAHDLSDAASARITFIATDGVVLGDSAISLEGLAALENHLTRPEVKSALAGKPGTATRLSRSTGMRLLYAAVPVRAEGRVVGVVRAAYSLEAIEAKAARVRQAIIALGVLVFLAAMVIAFALASSLSRPVREMSRVVERLAEGDYDARVGDVGQDEHGQLAKVLNDLAQRVQMTVQELSRDKGQLSAILTNMAEAVVAVDAGGRIIAVNPSLGRAFGVQAEQATGKQFIEVLRHHQLDQLVRGVLNDKRGRLEEVRTFVPDERIFEAQAAPLYEEGRFAGALVVLHDITRLRRLEQVRRDFVANVSHELRTPLTSIKGFAETLEMGAISDSKNAASFVRSIQKQADRMIALVEDLLDLAAIESGQRKPSIEAVAVGELMEDICSALRPLASKKKIELRIDAPPSLPPLAGDRGQLRQVFSNLLENAVKFTNAGSVSVAAAATGETLSISVTDTGIGIPTQDLSRIFERFYRVDKARSREMGGTGLGLSIVKHLVESHGGSIRVESSVGKGSTFIVLLPIYK